MILTFINKIGSNYKGNILYEFIFSSDIDKDEVTGEGWDSLPALGLPEIPDEEYILKVKILETDINFFLIKDDNRFSMWDAIEDVIPLAWEDLSEYDDDNFPDTRLNFRFGESIESVEEKLLNREESLNDID